MKRKVELAFEPEIDPEFKQEVEHVLRHEMDEAQAAVCALRHLRGMDVLEIINHTGIHEATDLHEAAVRRLGGEGMKFLLARFRMSEEELLELKNSLDGSFLKHG